MRNSEKKKQQAEPGCEEALPGRGCRHGSVPMEQRKFISRNSYDCRLREPVQISCRRAM